MAGTVHWHALGLAARGEFHVARGAASAARADLDGAVEALGTLGTRLELGRTLLLRAQFGTDPAADRDRARSLFAACGAAGDLARLVDST